MAKFQRADKTTVAGVLRRMAEAAFEDEGTAEVYAEEINTLLDNLLHQDFFGTEGQLDPRGDHRD